MATLSVVYTKKESVGSAFTSTNGFFLLCKYEGTMPNLHTLKRCGPPI